MKQLILVILLFIGSMNGYAQRNNNNGAVGNKSHIQSSKTSKSKQNNSNKPTQKSQNGRISPAPRVTASYSNGILAVNDINYPMVYVQGGSFPMGATSEQGKDAYKNEKLVHTVILSSYNIGKYEVTQDLWQAVMGNNPSSFKGSRKPVEQVSWDDCKIFISKLNSLTGKNFRLPTEAEWEFASRGGVKSKGYKYSGSNTPDDVAWHADNSGSTTHEVGTKSANELGIYDMSGNVWEWCSDWYGEYSIISSMTNPTGASSGSDRLNRGGSWSCNAIRCRVSYRTYDTPSYRLSDLGLRLVLSE